MFNHRIRQKVYEFLKKYRMDYASINIEEDVKLFLKEMENGLEGKKSSLKMIPTYLNVEKDIPTEEPVIVMDAGGTNFRVALVYFNKNREPVIEDFNIYAMPGTKSEITAEEFFDTLALYIKPLLDRSNNIGFCFSYPAEILPNKDGRLIDFCKEVQVKGARGRLIGESLINAINKIGHKSKKKVVILNDAVSTLFGAKASYADRVFDGYIGFILGTGTNTCYEERNFNIKKSPDISKKEGTTIINVESGLYELFQRGEIDIEFDRGTANPGDHVFEKMISGEYQGGLMLAVIRKAAENGLFSEDTAKNVLELKKLESKQIDEFLYYPYGDNKLANCFKCGNEADGITLYHLIDAMVERAAKLVTVNLSAVIIKTGKGINPCAPVCITAEGSTFYKSKLFKSKLEYYIKTYLNEQKEIYCEIVKADNATLIGTAIAGLQN